MVASASARRERMSSAESAITSAPQRSKKTAWRTSSTSWVARNASASPLGAARTKGARSAATRSSPT